MNPQNRNNHGAPQNPAHDNHGHDNHGNHKKIKCQTETCEKVTLTVPVEISAHADVKNVSLKFGDKRIIKEYDKPKKTLKLEVVQEIFAKIPIDFIAEVEIKDEKVDFDTHNCD